MKVYQMLLIGTAMIGYAIASEAQDYEAAAKAHNVDVKLLRAIVAVESEGHVGAINTVTHDYGLGQINHRTAAAYGFNETRLLTDVDYSLNSAAKVLSYFQKRYKHKEARWYCRYNVGTRRSASKSAACLTYVLKVQSQLNATAVVEGY